LLNAGNLLRYKTRGISNIIEQEKAVITVAKGLLLYVLNPLEESIDTVC